MAATKKSSAKKQASTKKSAAKKAPAKKAATKKAAAKNTTAKNTAAAKKPPAPAATSTVGKIELPTPRGPNKDGISYTKDFDVKFLKAQKDLLEAERLALVGQAESLEGEALALIEEAEMGDVQFDDEGGEGDTTVVERERDLALSAQARETVAEIDAALARLEEGTYGYSLISGEPISRERLEAIPWATQLVSEKVGGIGTR